ncbi:MAG: DUF2141 domain-containing protein [Spirochaetales bacterium]|nr:DUF2141 domain-containing protein [Spirochaetales bacterium]
MKHKRQLILILLITIPLFLISGQEQSDSMPNNMFSITGTIKSENLSGEAIYIMLVTEEIFKTQLASQQEIVIKMDNPAKNEYDFCFENVSPGTYGIRCFIDQDGNKKLNGGIGGPSEPWGMSWKDGKAKGWPKFKDISFIVNKNITKLEIEVK